MTLAARVEKILAEAGKGRQLPPVMPSGHVTTKEKFAKICDSDTLALRPCPTIKKDVTFLTYGLPRFRPRHAAPVAMLLHCLHEECLIHPFDTGFINKAQGYFALSQDGFETLLSETRVVGEVQRAGPALVNILFRGDNRLCVNASPPNSLADDFEENPTLKWLCKLYAAARKRPVVAGRILDSRIMSIELASTQIVSLRKNLRWLCVPISAKADMSRSEDLVGKLRESGALMTVKYYTPPDEWTETTSFELTARLAGFAESFLETLGLWGNQNQ